MQNLSIEQEYPEEAHCKPVEQAAIKSLGHLNCRVDIFSEIAAVNAHLPQVLN